MSEEYLLSIEEESNFPSYSTFDFKNNKQLLYDIHDEEPPCMFEYEDGLPENHVIFQSSEPKSQAKFHHGHSEFHGENTNNSNQHNNEINGQIYEHEYQCLEQQSEYNPEEKPNTEETNTQTLSNSYENVSGENSSASEFEPIPAKKRGRGRKATQASDSEKQKQNIKTCPYKYVLRNIGGKVLKLPRENEQFKNKVEGFCLQRGADASDLLNHIREEEKEIKKLLETRGALAKVFKERSNKHDAIKKQPAGGKRASNKVDHNKFRLVLSDMYNLLIQGYGVSYLTHAKIDSDKSCYFKTYATLIKALRNPQVLNTLKKE